MSNHRTLLLDRNYQPLRAVSWQKAITLVTLGKCEIVTSYDDEVRSPSLVIKIPAVARLLRVFKRFRQPVKFARLSVFARDKFCCQYCGKKKQLRELTYDHVIPRGQGGRSSFENVVACCHPCNRFKGNRTPEQAGMRLLHKPVRPDWVPAIEIKLSHQSVPQAWMDFIYFPSQES